MFKKFLSMFCFLTSLSVYSENKDFIRSFCKKTNHPFNYDLDVKLILSEEENSQYMVCFHGSGADNTIADTLKSYNVISDNLVSFNFPDYDTNLLEEDPKLSTFGTIQELLPALYILKNLVINGALTSINLYGFSSGGGVAVNIVTVLSGSRFEAELHSIGITQANKLQILRAIQNGCIILDCPLKSIEELIAFRGGYNKKLDNFLETCAQHYRENNLRPIDSVLCWKNLNLNILLYFERPDEMLSNRDDELYINAMLKHNLGTTHVLFGSHGGHCEKHDELWKRYLELRS